MTNKYTYVYVKGSSNMDRSGIEAVPTEELQCPDPIVASVNTRDDFDRAGRVIQDYLCNRSAEVLVPVLVFGAFLLAEELPELVCEGGVWQPTSKELRALFGYVRFFYPGNPHPKIEFAEGSLESFKLLKFAVSRYDSFPFTILDLGQVLIGQEKLTQLIHRIYGEPISWMYTMGDERVKGHHLGIALRQTIRNARDSKEVHYG